MSQAELLALIVSTLNSLDVPHMLVGSHASSIYGEARSTHDIDLVIDLPPEKILTLVARFDPERYYLSAVALREGRMANLIDMQTGDKVDLFLLSADPHGRAAFDRRQSATVMEVPVRVAAVEDTIVAKLHWSQQLGGSDRQLSDVREMVRLHREKLDLQLIERELRRLELLGSWRDLVRSIGG